MRRTADGPTEHARLKDYVASMPGKLLKRRSTKEVRAKSVLVAKLM